MRRTALIATLAALALGAAPGAADAPSPFVGAGELVGGHDYAYWIRTSIRSALDQTYRLRDGDAECITRGQHPPVWSVNADVRLEHVQTISCSVPAGRYILLADGAMLCSDIAHVPGFPTTDRGLERCARTLWHEYGDPHPRLVIDGVAIEPGGIRVSTPTFRFRMPAHRNVFSLPGRTHGRAAMAGIAALLRPLAPGTHKIVEAFHLRHDYNRVVILRLTVG